MEVYNYSNDAILLNSVEANWRKEDSSFILSNASINAMCVGVNYKDGTPVANQNKTWYVTPSRHIKYTGFQVPVKTSTSGMVGAKSEIQIKRGGSSWHLSLPVNYLSM